MGSGPYDRYTSSPLASFSAATTTNASPSSSRPLAVFGGWAWFAMSTIGMSIEIARPPSSAPYARDVTAATAHASSSAVGLAPGSPSSLHFAASAAGGATTG